MNYSYQLIFGGYLKRTVSLLLTVLFLFIYINPIISYADEATSSQPQKMAVNLKVEKILSQDNRGKYTNKGTTIEIVEVKPITNGVQVLARAWEKGKQIGFGPDGSVDIERFKIYNPPILVPDNNGNIKRESIDPDTKEKQETFYREDPKGALVQTLFQIISVKKEKFTNTQITPGKIGNTTSTFYSEPNPATTAGDGTWDLEVFPTWSSVHSATTSNTLEFSGNLIARNDQVFSNDWRIGRAFLNFDTSALGSMASITSATLNVTLGGNGIDISRHQRDVGVVQFFGSTPNAVNGDYDQFGTAEGAPRISLVLSQQAGTAYNFPFNATGTSWIEKNGITKLGLRGAYDIDNVPPPDDGQGRAQFYASDATGTTNDPNLVIEHVASQTTIRIYSQTGDGYVSNSYCEASSSWSNARNASSTTNVCDTQPFIKVRADSADGAYQIHRGSLVFDTSIIPDNATVTAATLNIQGTNSSGMNDTNLAIVSHSRATSTTLSAADWGITNYGSVLYGSTTSSLATSSYTVINLNSDGLSHVNKTGFSFFGILTTNDFENSDPGSSKSEADFASSDASGTSSDPYLEVTY